MLETVSSSNDNVIIVDLRAAVDLVAGNRFVEYAMYPRQNVSIRIIQDKSGPNITFAVGHSIFNRTCQTNIGSLMLKYGGGGHPKVGSCQVPIGEATGVFREILGS